MKFILFSIFLVQTLVTFSQQDTIVMNNGAVLFGELKGMQRGELTFDTDFANDDFKIDWMSLLQVKSEHRFLISLSNSQRIESRFSNENVKDGEVQLVDSEQFNVVKINEIVFFKPIENDFGSRFSADISLGANKAKSQNLLQIVGKTKVGYSGERFGLKANFNTLQSQQDDTEDSKRTTGLFGVEYYLPKDWFANLNTNFLSNTEQQLNLRNTTKAGAGKFIYHTNQSFLSAIGGIAYTHENFDIVNQDNLSSMEAFATIEFELFNLDNIELETEITAFPGITENDRFRSDISFDLKYDLPYDLFFDLGLQYNYDNQAIEASSKSDYVVQTTIGWEF